MDISRRRSAIFRSSQSFPSMATRARSKRQRVSNALKSSGESKEVRPSAAPAAEAAAVDEDYIPPFPDLQVDDEDKRRQLQAFLAAWDGVYERVEKDMRDKDLVIEDLVKQGSVKEEQLRMVEKKLLEAQEQALRFSKCNRQLAVKQDQLRVALKAVRESEEKVAERDKVVKQLVEQRDSLFRKCTVNLSKEQQTTLYPHRPQFVDSNKQLDRASYPAAALFQPAVRPTPQGPRGDRKRAQTHQGNSRHRQGVA